MSIDDRDWRRKELRLERQARNKIKVKKPFNFVYIFFLIFTASAAFLLSRWFF